MILRSIRPAFAGLGVLLAGAPPAPSPAIPLCDGLTIVTAVSQPDGDYESIKTIESVTGAELGINYSSESPENEVTSATSTL